MSESLTLLCREVVGEVSSEVMPRFARTADVVKGSCGGFALGLCQEGYSFEQPSPTLTCIATVGSVT